MSEAYEELRDKPLIFNRLITSYESNFEPIKAIDKNKDPQGRN
jgi:hypothetical protein